MSPFNLEHEIFFDDSIIAEYEREITKLNGIIAKKDLKIDGLEKKNSVFKKRLTKYYKQRQFTISDYVKENDTLNDELDKIEEERDELKSMNEMLTKNLSEVEEKIKKELQKSIKSEFESQKYFMKQEYEDQINMLERRIDELESDVKEMETEVELTEAIKDVLEDDFKKCKDEKQILQQKLDATESDYRILLQKNVELTEEIESMQNIQTDLDTLMKINEENERKLEEEIDELNAEADDLLTQNDALKLQNLDICELVFDKHEILKNLLAELFQSNEDGVKLSVSD